jgi:hypothetical protein
VSSMDPTLREFILFCVKRRGNAWPALYDEMARVAQQRLFQGMGYNDLRELGLSLSIDKLDRTLQLVRQATDSG